MRTQVSGQGFAALQVSAVHQHLSQWPGQPLKQIVIHLSSLNFTRLTKTAHNQAE